MPHTERDCFGADMTPVSIANEEASIPIRFCRGWGLKTVCKPLFSDFVGCPSFRIGSELPALLHVHRDPCSLKVLAFENNQQWNCRPVPTDTFNHCHPFLTSRFCSIHLLLAG